MAQEIDRERVRQLMEQGAQIVDVLPAREYGEDHLPGAVNLPLRRIGGTYRPAYSVSGWATSVTGPSPRDGTRAWS